MSRRINQADVLYALGFTPYDAANPAGYLAGPVPLPLAFVLPGKPQPGATFHLVMATRVILPANLAGTVAFAATAPTAAMPFQLNRLAGGVSRSAIGTVTIAAQSSVSVSLSQQAGVILSPGDVLQLVAPATQDATGADLGITILTTKG